MPTPPTPLSQIDTIVIVMMENRSFDHLLGYLSLSPHNRPIDGLINQLGWPPAFVVPYNNSAYTPWHLANAYTTLPGDPPHERVNIATQLAPLTNPPSPPTGFINSCPLSMDDVAGTNRPLVMAYHDQGEVPTADFFADQYTVCDRWFAPLPAGTQANRLMALSGYSLIDTNHSYTLLSRQTTVYDWLTSHGIRWRVYHENAPFIMAMDDWVVKWTASENFRLTADLARDVANEDASTFPQVIFVEPTYTSFPHLGQSDDDHPSTPIAFGQGFLQRTYNAITANPVRWGKTLMIVTYDEHGGFFDHVAPLPVTTPIPPGAEYQVPMTTTGVRVPGFLISPWIQAGGVHSEPIDHTAILALLGKRFSPDGVYSAAVTARGQGALSGAIDTALEDSPRSDIPAPPDSGKAYDRAWDLGDATAQLANTAFNAAVKDGRAAEALAKKFPGLIARL